jgi:glutamate racemase
MSDLLNSVPIGVFDSGVGGLSVLRAIRRALPQESLVYVADSAHIPYGERSPDYIDARVKVMAEFLLAQGVKAIVIACNTATVVAVQNLRAWCPVPVVAIEPAIKPATQQTRSGVVGVIGTSRTLASPNVARLCATYGANVDIHLQACPGLVEMVEDGALMADGTRALLTSYLKPMLDAGADILVLGCTHYPFLTQLIGEIVGPGVHLIDPADAVARELVRRLGDTRAEGDVELPGSEFFYATGLASRAEEMIGMLWGRPVRVLQVA